MQPVLGNQFPVSIAHPYTLHSPSHSHLHASRKANVRQYNTLSVPFFPSNSRRNPVEFPSAPSPVERIPIDRTHPCPPPRANAPAIDQFHPPPPGPSKDVGRFDESSVSEFQAREPSRPAVEPGSVVSVSDRIILAIIDTRSRSGTARLVKA